MTNSEPVALKPSLFRTLFFVAIAATGLVLIDGVLARTERLDMTADAARLYREGMDLLQKSQPAAAADRFRAAIADARDNPNYPLALGEALEKSGQTDEAAETLEDLLKSDSLAGAPNLAMARIYARQGRLAEAASYYHRAIYGQWHDDAQGKRIKARFELAELLASRGAPPGDLLAELLPLQGQAPADAGTQEKLGRLYLTAGAPARAYEIFQVLVRDDPEDPAARERLGDAEFARGNYAKAQTDYAAALRLRPEDRQARQKLELCDQVLALDPLRMGLVVEERYGRSVRVLELVAGRVAQCHASAHDVATAALLSSADLALKQCVLPVGQSDAAERNLDLAGRLWQDGRTACPVPVSPPASNASQ